LVDEIDFLDLSKHRWHLNNGYAARRVTIERNQRGVVYMHRQLLGPQKGFEVDHANGNKLDNRRHNLRIVPSFKNSANFSKKPSVHGFVGVSRFADRKKCWEARYSVRNKRIHIGFFSTAEEAARAYDAAVRKVRGSFARVNFPTTGELSIVKRV
jgi:hypothetical protein